LLAAEDAEFTFTVPDDECWMLHEMFVDLSFNVEFIAEFTTRLPPQNRVFTYAHQSTEPGIPTPIIHNLAHFHTASSRQWMSRPFITVPGDAHTIRTQTNPGAGLVTFSMRYELIPIPAAVDAGLAVQALAT